MAFTVRDLMFHVLPEPGTNESELRLCTLDTLVPPPEPLLPPKPGVPKPEPPKPGAPKPKPSQPGQPKPECAMDTITGASAAEAAPELPSLAVLREQLRQALHP